jgi:hypothetical protein
VRCGARNGTWNTFSRRADVPNRGVPA